MTEELALQDNYFRPTLTGLIVTGEPTYETWKNYGKKLHFIEGAIQWLIGDWLNFGERKYGETYSQALEAGASVQTWMNCKYVAGRFETYRRREVLSFSHHSEVAALDQETADCILCQAEEKDLSSRDLRILVRNLRHQNLLASSVSLNGKYQIIYADPPWRYEHPISISREVENQYPTMELEDICALEVNEQTIQQLSDKDSILFLWSTTPMTKKSLTVMESWGFEYRTNMVWIKPSIGMGQWVRQRHELLMIGVKGEMPTPMGENKPDSVIEAAREEHSKKPNIVYNLIEKMYPGFKKIELFAREQHSGWDAWGNEV
jgi:N6-adenosine-specific RNA methylase IME4